MEVTMLICWTRHQHKWNLGLTVWVYDPLNREEKGKLKLKVKGHTMISMWAFKDEHEFKAQV